MSRTKKKIQQDISFWLTTDGRVPWKYRRGQWQLSGPSCRLEISLNNRNCWQIRDVYPSIHILVGNADDASKPAGNCNHRQVKGPRRQNEENRGRKNQRSRRT